ncbi:MAG: CD225/dispanin family protein [Bacteroidota bacterium]
MEENTNVSTETGGGVKPKNWLVESILVTILCCLPFGIAGIVNASKVDSAWAQGNYDEANRAAEQAGKWTKIGFFLGLAGVVIYILIFVVMGVGGAMAGGF